MHSGAGLSSSKRVLNQSVGKFVNARKISEDGALDHIDISPIDPFNPDDPNDRKVRPCAASTDNIGVSRDGEALLEPALALGSHGGSPSRIVSVAPARNNDSRGYIGDSRDGEAEIDGLASDENSVRQTTVKAPPGDVRAKTPATTLAAEASCDDNQIPRNEAIESVHGPLSVVRCEVGTSDEPYAPYAVALENATHEFAPSFATIRRARTRVAFQQGEPPWA